MSSPTADDRHPARLPPRLVASAGRRRLAAILHADLADYVRLMEDAEDRTVSRLKSVRAEVWRPAVEAAGGRIVNIVADSVLAEFGSAVAAVSAAVDIQERMARFNDRLVADQHLMFRIGLHLGEVIVDEAETIFGDAVNIAARIQLLAEPGGIAASRALRDATHLQVDCAFVDGGRHHAKNVRHSLQIYHVQPRQGTSRLPVRAASRMRRAGIKIRGPMLWGTLAAATLLLAGSSYLAFTPTPATSVSTAALSLSAEQLEQALAERRKADALAAEKRQLEEQARGRAEAEAVAKRQADLELETARQARQTAERELAQLKADIEARRNAKDGGGDQATATAQRAAEEAAQRRAEAEAAALRRNEEEAAKKAAATLSRHDEDAESMERRLRLQQADRQRLQVALTSLGFDTRGDDGVFGPRSREMIARWQTARDQAPTGFVTRAQQQALLKEAAPALSNYDEQRKAQQYVRTTTDVSAVLPASPATITAAYDGTPSLPSPDGLWRGTYRCTASFHPGLPFVIDLNLHLTNGTATWRSVGPGTINGNSYAVAVSVARDLASVVRTHIRTGGMNGFQATLTGRYDGATINATGRESSSGRDCTLALTR